MRYHVAISALRTGPVAATVSPSMDAGSWLQMLHLKISGKLIPFSMQQFDSKEAAMDDANDMLEVASADWVEVDEHEVEEFILSRTNPRTGRASKRRSVDANFEGCESTQTREERSKELPAAPMALLLRTDFSDDAAWGAVCEAVQEPSEEGFQADIECVSDPAYRDLTDDRLLELASKGQHTFVFLADVRSMTDRERTVRVVDLSDEPGRNFRVIPSEVWNVENNLSISNCEFEDFANSVDELGVFRGYPRN